jgi:hypothetical protein
MVTVLLLLLLMLLMLPCFQWRTFFCKEKSLPGTARCFVCMHPAIREKDCRNTGCGFSAFTSGRV